MADTKPYGCHVELDPGQPPDGCVLDDGNPEHCVYTYDPEVRRLGKHGCPHWRPIDGSPKQRAYTQDEWDELIAELDAAIASAAKWPEACGEAHVNLMVEVDHHRARAETAEAEIDRLHRILHLIAHADEQAEDFEDLVRKIARENRT